MDATIRLTLRETEVLGLISRGCSYKKAARQLGISAHTVATYIKSIYRKLDVHTAGAAVMRAVELHQLVPGATPMPLTGEATWTE